MKGMKEIFEIPFIPFIPVEISLLSSLGITQLAVSHAVSKVDHQADRHPDDQTRPSVEG